MSHDTDEADLFARARIAAMVGLFLMGSPVGTLLPRLAEIKQGLGASSGSFGTAVAFGAVGAILGNFTGAHVVPRFGSRPVASGIMVVMLVANLGNALVGSVTGLSAISVLGGFSYSLCFIAMNSQGVLVEQRLGRSFLPMMHAYWSLGTVVTAIASSLAAPHISPLTALLVCDTLVMAAWLLNSRRLLPVQYDERPHNDPTQLPRDERIPRAALRFLLVIAVAQWLSLQAEISVADWSSVLLKEDFAIPVGPNGYGYAAFVVLQLATRLAAPRWIDRYGLNRVVYALGWLGSVGYLVALTLASRAQQPGMALVYSCVAFAFISIGCAAMPPAQASAAGAIPGLPSSRALMVVGVTSAVLSVPGRIGLAYFAQAVSLPIALTVMGLFLLGATLMSSSLHPDRARSHAIAR